VAAYGAGHGDQELMVGIVFQVKVHRIATATMILIALASLSVPPSAFAWAVPSLPPVFVDMTLVKSLVELFMSLRNEDSSPPSTPPSRVT
jgi:hypothetical protein